MKPYDYVSPLGVIEILGSESAISSIAFVDRTQFESANEATSAAVKECVRQLDDYFSGSRAEFSVPLDPIGTDFQKRVWAELQKTRFGETISYQELANRLGDPKSVRAVGGANGKNPIAIIVPCHRVIGASGKLVGYSGGLERKKWLLRHELEFRKSEAELF